MRISDITETINGLWVGKKPPFKTVAVIRNTNFTKDCRLDLTNVAYLDVEEKQFSKRKLYPGDIIIEKSGGSDKQPVGRPILFDIPDGDYSFSNFTSVLRVRDRSVVLPEYLQIAIYGKYLQGVTRKMQSKTTGIHNLDFNSFKNIEIPIPSIREQERIVYELNKAKAILLKKGQQLDILDELELSIFYDSFGNPVSNPLEWDSAPMSDVTSLITDGSHYSPKDEEMGTIPMLSVKNMGARGFDYTDCKMISQEEFKKLEAAGCKPMPDDVLVAKDGSYFKKIFVHQSEAPQAILSSIAIVRPDQTKVTPEFLCTLLSTPDIYNLVEERYLTGTAIKRVILKGLRQLKIIVPPMEMQKQFSKKIWRINAQRSLIEESVVEAQKLFDSRMNYYFGD